ncbi:murein biosynthesis integral membrane protein MurJ [Virgibacillus sediminis]|uniref:Lipid II flippase n=1 Tax=Virgibacillus sediminis TaxID=202260 RepID=A0ABV7A4L0_9BACI
MRLFKILGAVALINIIARLLGFAREVVIGYQYGTSYQADSIITAFTVPNFIYIVVGGAITTAFISVYTKLEKGAREQFFQTIFTLLILITGSITVLFLLFPVFWMNLFFSGMSEEAMQLTSELFVWMAPATVFLVIAMLFSGLHNINENYRLSSMATLVFNGLFLLVGVGLTPFLMEYSYGLGALLGSLFMAAMLMYTIHSRSKMPLKLRVTLQPEVKRFAKLALPILFGGATIQFYFIIQRIYASSLDEGAISALNYASKMTQFPQAVLMTSVTTVIYPLMAKAVGEKDERKVTSAYRKGFRMLTILLLPATVFMILYAEEVIRFIFEYGSFGSQSTNTTYPLLQIFSLSIFSLALNAYVTRFFYAMEKSYLPVTLNILSVFGVNILVIHLLIDQLGVDAVAWGTVAGTTANMLLLLVAAKWKLELSVSSISYIVKLLIFVLIAGAAIWLTTLPELPPLFSLALGGVATALFILVGLKIVK